MRTHVKRVLALAAVLALPLAACGDDDDSGSSSGSGSGSGSASGTEATTGGGSSDGENVVAVIAQGVNFDQDEYTAAAGTVTFTYENSSGHNIVIEEADDTEVVGFGESEGSIDLEPGTYTMYCEPHRGAGMEATLVVE